MFCEPLQQNDQDVSGQPVAIVPEDVRVVYHPQSCEPDIDADGKVVVRESGGALARVLPEYRNDLYSLNDVVWRPAYGDLDGSKVIMTARFLAHDATLRRDPGGAPLVYINMTPAGRQVFGSLTERIAPTRDRVRQGYVPLATFLNGVAIEDGRGRILAPSVVSKITDTLVVSGLQEADASRLVDLLNAGELR